MYAKGVPSTSVDNASYKLPFVVLKSNDRTAIRDIAC